jgi:hypothetical protein
MTTLSLTGIDVGPDGALVFRFLEGGRAFTWHFRATSFPEFLALLLGGRLGAGNEVHFDAAQVTIEEPRDHKPGRVGIAIGEKATIVAPLPSTAHGTTSRSPQRTR